MGMWAQYKEKAKWCLSSGGAVLLQIMKGSFYYCSDMEFQLMHSMIHLYEWQFCCGRFGFMALKNNVTNICNNWWKIIYGKLGFGICLSMIKVASLGASAAWIQYLQKSFKGMAGFSQEQTWMPNGSVKRSVWLLFVVLACSLQLSGELNSSSILNMSALMVYFIDKEMATLKKSLQCRIFWYWRQSIWKITLPCQWNSFILFQVCEMNERTSGQQCK